MKVSVLSKFVLGASVLLIILLVSIVGFIAFFKNILLGIFISILTAFGIYYYLKLAHLVSIKLREKYDKYYPYMDLHGDNYIVGNYNKWEGEGKNIIKQKGYYFPREKLILKDEKLAMRIYDEVLEKCDELNIKVEKNIEEEKLKHVKPIRIL